MSLKHMIATMVAVAATPCVTADFVPVTISGSINTDLRTYTGGWGYPIGGQDAYFGGVPFALSLQDRAPNTLGGIQLPASGELTVHSFSVNLTGATHLYTLINSTWGVVGATNGKVEVFGTNGAYASLTLIQGVNIRDHYQGTYQNSISDPTVLPTLFSSGVRLDRQVIELPASFDGQTVTEVRFQGIGDNPNGSAFLVGATFKTLDACFGDFDHNGSVGASDLAILLGAWATPGADLDGDGTTSAPDLALILGAWGACP